MQTEPVAKPNAVSLVPDFLFHYTSIDALAMILKEKRIRLSPLTDVDDISETLIQDSQGFARFVYISSWMDGDQESLPMWNMYSTLDRGVRIRLPSMPFGEYFADTSPASLSRYRERDITPPGFGTILPFDVLLSLPNIPFPYTRKDLLKKVIYTEDESLLCPKLMDENNGSLTIAFGKLGVYKRKVWEFQREWRYSVWLAPLAFSELHLREEEVRRLAVERLMDDKYVLPQRYFYLPISYEAFGRMQVTLSPKISPSSRLIVELLKENLNPAMEIVESRLAGTLR